jgi:peptide/nickel transport system substrate-binding protein
MRSLVPKPGGNNRISRRDMAVRTAAAVIGDASRTAQASGAAGQLVHGANILLAPVWFDPAETQGIIPPRKLPDALRDGLVKPMPGEARCKASPTRRRARS